MRGFILLWAVCMATLLVWDEALVNFGLSMWERAPLNILFVVVFMKCWPEDERGGDTHG